MNNLKTSNKENILQPSASVKDFAVDGPTIMESAQGVYIEDIDGNRLIDGVGGLWCVNIGYGNKNVAEAACKASNTLSYFHTFNGMSNIPQIELSKKLLHLVPNSLDKVFYGNSGSDANDTLIKLAWHYNVIKERPHKKKIISRRQAYHGTSLLTSSLTGLKNFHIGYHLPFEFTIHVDTPFFYKFGLENETEEQYTQRLLKNIEHTINVEGPDTIAAFIAEPIIGAGGVITPPKGYFSGLQKILKKYDILFIVDEVVCGFGRLGTWFGSDYYELNPDMMATAKGITSGYFPLSAAFINKEIWYTLKKGSDIFGNLAHGYTYSGHPVGCSVAIANLNEIENQHLVSNAKNMGKYLHRRLNEVIGTLEHVGEIRGHGLIAGIQLIKNKDKKEFFDPNLMIANKISQQAYENGVIIRALPSLSTLAISPPLTITESQIDTLVKGIYKAYKTILS